MYSLVIYIPQKPIHPIHELSQKTAHNLIDGYMHNCNGEPITVEVYFKGKHQQTFHCSDYHKGTPCSSLS